MKEKGMDDRIGGWRGRERRKGRGERREGTDNGGAMRK